MADFWNGSCLGIPPRAEEQVPGAHRVGRTRSEERLCSYPRVRRSERRQGMVTAPNKREALSRGKGGVSHGFVKHDGKKQ